MNAPTTNSSASPPRRPTLRHPWKAPLLEALPRLSELTLQTGDPIEGDGDTGSGSTVF